MLDELAGPEDADRPKRSEIADSKVEKGYDDSDLRTMKGLETVRAKPGMYLGGTDARALHHCVGEVLDNSVDEFLAGCCTRVDVTLHANGTVSVEDDGPGIPVAINKESGLPEVEVALTILHTGRKYGRKNFEYSGCTHGVGAKCVNAVSEWFRAESRRDGKLYTIGFERGKTTEKLRIARNLKAGERTGTRITFKPDPLILQTTSFDPERIRERLREIAFCHPTLKLTFCDELSGGDRERIPSDGGFPELAFAGKGIRRVCDWITITGEEQRIRARIVLRYVTGAQGAVVSFVNSIRAIEGGTHVSGLVNGMARALTVIARRAGLLAGRGAKVRKREAMQGLVATIAVLYPDPRYEASTKSKLINPDAATAVDRITFDRMLGYFGRHRAVAKGLLAHCLRERRPGQGFS